MTPGQLRNEVITAFRLSGLDCCTWSDAALGKLAELAIQTVIAGMREPAEAVISAHHVVPDDTDFRERVVDNWHALVDAALSEYAPKT